MDYHFDPHRVREAYQQVSQRFGGQNSEPLGLAKLFLTIEQMDTVGLVSLSRYLEARELDLLCQAFHRAPNHRTLMGIALILGFLRDRRFGEVMRHFLFQLPPASLLETVAEVWQREDLDGLLSSELTWIGQFFNSGQTDLPAFVIEAVTAGKLALSSILTDAIMSGPLAKALLSHVFTRGVDLIPRIPFVQARTIAAQFLVDRRDAELQAFFNHYPERGWPPAFLDLVYQAKGMPDPETRPFYRVLEKGRLWAFRQKLFQARMGDGGDMQDSDPFWQRWFHRFQDWKRVDGVTYIQARPLKIVDWETKTEISLAADPGAPPDVLEKDTVWEAKMEALLQENMGW